MPAPWGHAVIGATIGSWKKEKKSKIFWRIVFVIALTNLPDVDVVGRLFDYDIHRGPTHSLVFCAISGYIASWLSVKLKILPPMSFSICASLVLSHVLADYFITPWSISFFYPFSTPVHLIPVEKLLFLQKLFLEYRFVKLLLLSGLVLSIRWVITQQRKTVRLRRTVALKSKEI